MIAFKMGCIALVSLFVFSNIYDISIPKIEGGSYSLSACREKRMMIITLPVVETPAADSLLLGLDSIANEHSDSLTVLAVPAFEDGFSPANKESLITWYRSKLGNRVILSDGLYTRKTSGVNQHSLFSWLTKATQNGLLDIDVEGPGYKFFIDNRGVLIGLLRPHTRLGSETVHDLITQSLED